ncbi:MAG: glycoside hydrolase family 31 protein [Bacteroidales bacterium]|nr:glycoside hydrolase family 31 protein [Bacteroidales bacterium]MDD3152085.1 glycoside hydrolase family 31 protein [Bacteroidales bacterium]MDD3914836.1 glycoside hydrolase family 31 protein [Bacteroidales bacterium]MDD4633847.1 glycoside hydrolase family 31 protein [Bacteroidales bacterium]
MKKILFLTLIIACFTLHSCVERLPQNADFDGKELIIKTENDVYTISALSPEIIKVACNNDEFYGDRVYAPIIKKPIKTKCKYNDSIIVFSTSDVELRITLASEIEFSFVDNQNIKATNKGGYTNISDTLKLDFTLDEQEEIYGTGARALPLNRHGYKFQCYNQANYGYGIGADFLNYSVPAFMSSKKYMILIDNPARAYFDIGKTDSDILEFGSKGGNMVYYFINGEDYSELFANYGTLTGFQPLPPIWAFGNLQSRFGYRSQAEVEGIVSIMKSFGYPIDAIIIDLYWFGQELEDGEMGNFSWDKEFWHSPEQMIADFKDKGVKTITVSEPFFTRKSFRFKEVSDLGYLCKDSLGNTMTMPYFYFGDGGLIDIFNPEACDWFWKLYQTQKELGVAAWWGDLGEPEVHPDDIVHVNGKGYEVHGAYGDGWIKMLYDNYAKYYPDERLFMLARAGYAGTQKYGILPWTGDVSRTWQGLEAQPPAMLGSSMSGICYMHSDAGGFAMGKRDSILYTRWMQYAVFTPIFRPHGDIATAPNEPVFYDDETQRIVKSFIKLRYKMLPYNYTVAFKNMTTGTPLARPLLLYYEDDTIAKNIYDEYLWGKDILVAPIFQDTTHVRTVYLPDKDATWFELLSNRHFEGGKYYNIFYTLNNYPAFVRGGSIIPLYEKPIYTTDNYVTDTISLHCYYSPSAKDYNTEIYFDDGKSKNSYVNGEYELINISADYSPEDINIVIENQKTKIKNSRVYRIVIKNMTKKPDKLTINNIENNFIWDKSTATINFYCTHNTKSTISIKL